MNLYQRKVSNWHICEVDRTSAAEGDNRHSRGGSNFLGCPTQSSGASGGMFQKGENQTLGSGAGSVPGRIMRAVIRGRSGVKSK